MNHYANDPVISKKWHEHKDGKNKIQNGIFSGSALFFTSTVVREVTCEPHVNTIWKKKIRADNFQLDGY